MIIPLPWLLAAALTLLGGGYIWGSANSRSACDIEAAEARGVASERYAQELTRATEASLANQGVAIELNTTLHVHRTKSAQLVREVHADVDAHPDLAACLVPDATQRLRHEQVADSARIAADHRPMQR